MVLLVGLVWCEWRLVSSAAGVTVSVTTVITQLTRQTDTPVSDMSVCYQSLSLSSDLHLIIKGQGQDCVNCCQTAVDLFLSPAPFNFIQRPVIINCECDYQWFVMRRDVL